MLSTHDSSILFLKRQYASVCKRLKQTVCNTVNKSFREFDSHHLLQYGGMTEWQLRQTVNLLPLRATKVRVLLPPPIYNLYFQPMVNVAKLVDAPDCGSGIC